MILHTGRREVIDVGPSWARSQNRRGAAIPAVRHSDGIGPKVGATQHRSNRPSPWRATASIEAMG